MMSRILKLITVWVIGILMALPVNSFAEVQRADFVKPVSIDRLDIVKQQISLLKSRLTQADRELASYERNDLTLPVTSLDQAGKSLLEKAALDITVAKSNLESISIELTDAKQAVNWLAKNIREAENQLNVLKIFGNRMAANEMINVQQVRADKSYQEKLMALENERAELLRRLQDDAVSILQIKRDQLTRLNAQLKSQTLIRMKQQEARDELAFQEQQNQWLQRLNDLYGELNKTNPVTARTQYRHLESEIFAANEQANHAYAESLIARYRDQIHQLTSVPLKSSSIGQLNDLNERSKLLARQIDRLDNVLTTRNTALSDRVNLLSQKKNTTDEDATRIANMQSLLVKYNHSMSALKLLIANHNEFRGSLSRAMRVELSVRQGFPSFEMKTLLDLGKEMLLVPALAFQVVKSLTVVLVTNVHEATPLIWAMFVGVQILLVFIFWLTYKLIQHLLQRPCEWREKINSKWLSLKWLDHHFIDLYLLSTVVCTMFIFDVPLNNYIFFVYLAGVWFVFKSMIVIARICLVETIDHNSGKDIRLYHRLKWTIWSGGVATAAVVFVYQLPLIYELKTLADRLFLLFMMIISLVLLRFWDVVPNLILKHMELRHPYLEKSIRLLGVLVPLLMFGNSLIGLLGYVNLVMTVSWYEGIFLMVLIGYLVLRGLLTDSVEQFSRVVIQHSSNGWLLTEAFLKPLDRILRIVLLFAAGAVLFLLYGWNEQSPVVERLNGLLHYPLIVFYNSAITPLRIVGLVVVVSTFYWTAKWTREFVFRLLQNRTTDMGIRNSMAILSQYAVIVIGIIFSLQVLGIDSRALAAVAAAFAFGVGLGLRDLANNFFCGFLILLERPVRVGDIISVNDIEGEVIHIGSRAITVMTWDHTAYVVPNTEIFNKSFTNLTARDNVVRCVVRLKIARTDNPHQVQQIIHDVISQNRNILPDPLPEVFLKEMNDTLLNFELRYYVNIRQVRSRTMVVSALLMAIWDAFEHHGIKPPYPQQEIFLRHEPMAAEARLVENRLEEVIN